MDKKNKLVAELMEMNNNAIIELQESILAIDKNISVYNGKITELNIQKKEILNQISGLKKENNTLSKPISLTPVKPKPKQKTLIKRTQSKKTKEFFEDVVEDVVEENDKNRIDLYQFFLKPEQESFKTRRKFANKYSQRFIDFLEQKEYDVFKNYCNSLNRIITSDDNKSSMNFNVSSLKDEISRSISMYYTRDLSTTIPIYSCSLSHKSNAKGRHSKKAIKSLMYIVNHIDKILTYIRTN